MAPPYDRLKDLKDIDNTKAGIKGLVDANIQNVPQIFVCPPEDVTADGPDPDPGLENPVIDLGELRGTGRSELVSRVGAAARDVGFFQVVNHGIGSDVLDRMLEGARAFHEMGRDAKVEYYSRDLERLVRFSSNYDLFQSQVRKLEGYPSLRDGATGVGSSGVAHWLRGHFNGVQRTCEGIFNVLKHLFELLSEALGLEWDYLRDSECAKGHAVLCHCYPACPEPHLTMGATRHSDPAFLTILLQDNIGGLQVMYRDQLVGVPPVPGALVVNIGDLFQSPRLYGPIKELLSDDNPALYREMTINVFAAEAYARGIDGKRKTLLAHFKLQA